jgi:hypothetical protein
MVTCGFLLARTSAAHYKAGMRIKTMTLLLCGVLLCVGSAGAQAPPRDGQHDFDFVFGVWHAKVARLTNPLSGSTTWAHYEGPSIVRRIWDGGGNLGEIDLAGPAGRIRGMSLRLYDPQARQWSIRWANARDGSLGEPMIGGFANGRGEFYNQETYEGRAVFVRFIFSDITAKTFRLEQAFSADGGKSWEANWIATFERRKPAS